jgi:amidase
MDIAGLGLRAIAAAVNQDLVTAETVTRMTLERIAALEPEIGAFAWLDADAAIAQARAIDARPGKLPMKGVPLGVKDVVDTFDMPTGYGAAIYDRFRPAADAAGVALAREAGAVIIGKTVSTEFAANSPGLTRNPHSQAHTPGGSSSGSAAAVGAGMIRIAYGTQTAGSIIRPASYCGAVGYKPSFGLLDRTGVKTLADSLDTLGLLAGSVNDAAYFAAVIAGRAALNALALPADLRIGLYDPAGWGEGNAALLAAVRATSLPLVEIPRLAAHDALLAAQQTIMDWEVPRALAFERTRHFAMLRPATREFLSRPPPDAATYDAARQLAAEARAGLAACFGACQVWLAPSGPGPAPIGLGATGDPVFNRVWTLLHVPCVSIPCLRRHGLPVGLQVIGPPGQDANTLAIAAFLEQEFANVD